MGDFSSRLKLRQLAVLLAVAEHGSLVKAAARLGMSQPAVTKYLAELERAVGTALFDRHVRGVTPTVFGEVLIRHARLVMAELRDADREFAALGSGHVGTVAVGTLLAAAPRLLPKSIALLKQQRPGLAVSVVEGTNDRLIPALLLGGLDIVVGRLPDDRSQCGLVHEVLYDEPVRIVVRAGHPLARRRRPALADLLGAQWILPPPETTLRQQIEEAFRRAGLQAPAHPVECVSILTIRTLLLETDMVGVLPDQVVRSDMDLGLLTTLPVALPTTLGPVGITTRAGRAATPAAELLCDCLRRVSREVPVARVRPRARA